MMKIIKVLACSLVLTGCATSIDNFRDGLAAAIETEERATKPDRVQIVPEYVEIPDQYTNREACPPPPVIDPEDIAEWTWEGDYNQNYVAVVFSNNEKCFLSMRAIDRYDETQAGLNTSSEEGKNDDDNQ